MTKDELTDLLDDTQRQRFHAELQIARASNGINIAENVENLRNWVGYLRNVETALEVHVNDLEKINELRDEVKDLESEIRELRDQRDRAEDLAEERLDTINELEQRIRQLENAR